MNYDELDRCYEEFEFLDLADEYLKKTKTLFDEKIKDYKDSLKHEKELASKTVKEYQELENERKELNQQKANIEEHKNEVIQSMLAKFGLDLKPGQEVYVIVKHSESHKCEHCDEGKLIQTINGLRYEAVCPHCKGRGVTYTYTYEIVSGKVSDVKIQLYWNVRTETLELSSNNWLESAMNIYVDRLPYKSFGSTCRSFKREEIYLTREEAEKELQKILESNSSND